MQIDTWDPFVERDFQLVNLSHVMILVKAWTHKMTSWPISPIISDYHVICRWKIICE